MKIGVIGLGNIAQKAYLPVYGSLQNENEFILCGRNKEAVDNLREKYSFNKSVYSVEDLIVEKPDAVFVHVPTQVHFEVCQTLLAAGINVYVDKPASENYQEVLALTQLAEEKNVIFMIGFNRRFLPRLDIIDDRYNVLKLTKNLSDYPLDITEALYDLFIHVLDTAIYLQKETILKVSHFFNVKEGIFLDGVMVLESENKRSIVSMNLKSGANTEVYEFESPEQTIELRELSELKIISPKSQEMLNTSNWENTLEKRGFVFAVNSFIEAVATGNQDKLRQDNVLLSHEIIANAIKDYQ